MPPYSTLAIVLVNFDTIVWFITKHKWSILEIGQQTITWTNDDQYLWCHMPLLDNNELMYMMIQGL